MEKFAQVAALRLPSGGFPLRSVPFPLLSVGLSGGVRRKSPYRFNRAGGKCRPRVYARTDTRLCLTAGKRFLVLFGVSAKKNTLRHPALPVLKRYENSRQKGKILSGETGYLPRKNGLNSAFIAIAVKMLSRNNHMVEQSDIYRLACRCDCLCQPVIVMARLLAAAGVVVAKNKTCRTA